MLGPKPLKDYYSKNTVVFLYTFFLIIYSLKSNSIVIKFPLVQYFQRDIGFSESNAGSLMHVGTYLSKLFIVIGGILGDGYLGLYPTLIIGNIITIISCFLMVLVGHSKSSLMCWISFMVFSIFYGMSFPVLTTIRNSQYIGNDEERHVHQNTFYAYYCLNILAFLVLLFVPDAFKRFGIFAPFYYYAIVLLISLILLIMFYKSFYHQPRDNDKIKSFINLLFKKIDMTEEKMKERKAILQLITITIPLAMFQVLYRLKESCWIQAGNKMNKNFYGYQIEPQQIELINIAIVILLSPFIRTYITTYLVKKIGVLKTLIIAMFILILSYAINTVVDIISLSTQLHIAYQLPSYIIVTLAEVMFFPTLESFIYILSPPGYKTILQSLADIYTSIYGLIYMTALKKISALFGKYKFIIEQTTTSAILLVIAISLLLFYKGNFNKIGKKEKKIKI
ncbi:Proton/peptide symporter family protein [Spraguea lophii 42_110]|uniref:Proton/peptide symporter family protein n=1 Tax=Spraguea lophii (strain 42_110) TaxID=1358809 RepID=S7XG17_SPRLO|nr:Proton/peptide symporter family protein [Spraguea lophii 42_110]